MWKRPAAAALLLACAFAVRGADLYQIELVPTGKILAQTAPVTRGTTILFRRYPDGMLISMRRSEVKSVAPISAEAASAANPAESVVRIGNLAMQGGSTQAGPASASSVAPKPRGPELGKGFYENVVPGATQGYPAAPGDYQIGRTFAAPPSSSVQAAPGAPPTNPGATSGQNPPQ